ncbi:hypothetical protein HY642_04015 [Candidatus Woesearchaeota archaeon]|nr:hypothetical protein [Candidatus Woesearchaeota archaeon]
MNELSLRVEDRGNLIERIQDAVGLDDEDRLHRFLTDSVPAIAKRALHKQLKKEQQGESPDWKNEAVWRALRDLYQHPQLDAPRNLLEGKTLSEQAKLLTRTPTEAAELVTWYHGKLESTLERRGYTLQDGKVVGQDGEFRPSPAAKQDSFFDLFSHAAMVDCDNYRKAERSRMRWRKAAWATVASAAIAATGWFGFQYKKDQDLEHARQVTQEEQSRRYLAEQQARNEAMQREQALAGKAYAENLAAEKEASERKAQQEKLVAEAHAREMASKSEQALTEAQKANATAQEYKTAANQALAAKSELETSVSKLTEQELRAREQASKAEQDVAKKARELQELNSRLDAAKQQTAEYEKLQASQAQELERKQRELEMAQRVKNDLEGLLGSTDDRYNSLIDFYNRNVGNIEVQDRAIYDEIIRRWQAEHAKRMAGFKPSEWRLTEGAKTVDALQSRIAKADELYQGNDYVGMARALQNAAEHIPEAHSEEVEQELGINLKQLYVGKIVENEERRAINEYHQVAGAYADIMLKLGESLGHFKLENAEEPDYPSQKVRAVLDTAWFDSAIKLQGWYKEKVMQPFAAQYFYLKDLIAQSKQLEQRETLNKTAKDDLHSKTSLMEERLQNAWIVLDNMMHGQAGRYSSTEWGALHGQDRLETELNDAWEPEWEKCKQELYKECLKK